MVDEKGKIENEVSGGLDPRKIRRNCSYVIEGMWHILSDARYPGIVQMR